MATRGLKEIATITGVWKSLAVDLILLLEIVFGLVVLNSG